MDCGYGIYLVGIIDSTPDMPGKSFTPLGPYGDDEAAAIMRGRLWIADTYEESTGAIQVTTRGLTDATKRANAYLRDEYAALRSASLLAVCEGETA